MVRSLRAAHNHLIRDDGSFAMEPQRLFRRQMPLIPETLTAVAGAKFPEGCIPRRTVASVRLRARGNQPPLHHFLQEAVSNQSLKVDSAEIGGAKHAASRSEER